MSASDGSNGQTGETAWHVTVVSAVLVLASALGVLASIRAFVFFLSQVSGVVSFMVSGALLLVTLASVTPVFLIALAWLWSFRPPRLFAKKGHACEQPR